MSIFENPDQKRQRETLERLFSLHSFYQCKKDREGRRIGCLVASDRKYPSRWKPEGEHFFAESYLNMPRALSTPAANEEFAQKLLDYYKLFHREPKIDYLVYADGYSGPLAHEMAKLFSCKYIHAVDAWHSDIPLNSNVLLVNGEWHNNVPIENFYQKYCQGFGTVKVVGALCIVNSSGRSRWQGQLSLLQIYSLANVYYQIYRQDDPKIKDDLVVGKMIWPWQRQTLWEE
ncbi:TPA: hypothetical protein DD449_01090 [Candidatus Berkelbacteria bacterium]|uniref:Uncharacterized protein n=1 Tax=Berkelbacteria bacterium GW2011_GWE1_39_12 TaxID=1618337 RepID=A0A0G4B3V5_9BACT|nr:MAG: hypothetical protein UT28_C0001G0869 [Berkelbacteria bacterium GW2011_GWE1_39_12]HBO60267.1 hypothetical protein [Candidatus Berkelbacteria bacterium]